MSFRNRCAAVALAAALLLPLSAGRADTLGDVFATMLFVGDPGNAADAGDAFARGTVDTSFQIMSTEVTAGMWVDFLTAKAVSDPHGLMPEVDLVGHKQINRSGSSGSYTYALVSEDLRHHPIMDISWYDALRFANWLHNGGGSGDTEDGAYDMSLSDPVRNANAQFALPTMDEWYKAAFYDPAGGGIYYDYPTSSDTVPTSEAPAGGSNSANYKQDDAFAVGAPYFRNEVGAYESTTSPWGAFDMAGNVAEWVESVTTDTKRGIMGGSYLYSSPTGISADWFNGAVPTDEYRDVGFRLVIPGGLGSEPPAPEPATLALLGIGGAATLLGLRRRRTR